MAKDCYISGIWHFQKDFMMARKFIGTYQAIRGLTN